MFRSAILLLMFIIAIGFVNARNDGFSDLNQCVVCNTIIFFNVSDTVQVTIAEYKLESNAAGYNLSILSKRKLNAIRKLRNVNIQFCLQNKVWIAKGNYIFRSDVPTNADYFFSTDKNGRLFIFKKNEIGLLKCNDHGKQSVCLKQDCLMVFHFTRKAFGCNATK